MRGRFVAFEQPGSTRDQRARANTGDIFLSAKNLRVSGCGAAARVPPVPTRREQNGEVARASVKGSVWNYRQPDPDDVVMRFQGGIFVKP